MSYIIYLNTHIRLVRVQKLTAWLKLSFPFVFRCQNTLWQRLWSAFHVYFCAFLGNMTCKAHHVWNLHTKTKVNIEPFTCIMILTCLIWFPLAENISLYVYMQKFHFAQRVHMLSRHTYRHFKGKLFIFFLLYVAETDTHKLMPVVKEYNLFECICTEKTKEWTVNY